jgi:hypothetical protein
MRKTLFVTGWVILFVLPLAFIAEILLSQDLPPVQPWKWVILAFAVLLVYVNRDRDSVLKHHIV